MKKLTKMMLTKWHYFEHKIIDFDDINFLTGKNSSGKSTLIDAMQVVLLGETDGTSFNKAADIKANRSFTSYIIGELGDDVNGGEKSLRGGKEFTTQLVCEFKDTMNDEYFCIGILVDSYSDMANAKRVFFRLRDRLDESDYIYNNQPRNINQFKSWCREKYGKDDKTIKFMDTNTEYRQNILSMYNVHDRKMFTLLKKSISFKRIDNIENFITENICDVKNEIDIRSMQLNVYEYEKQKEKADQLEKQERELAEINNLYEKYSNKKRNIKIRRKEIKMLHPSYSDLMAIANSDVEEGEHPVVQSRYSIVMATSKRARQIIAGDAPLIDDADDKKPLSIAVEELYKSKIKILGDDESEN